MEKVLVSGGAGYIGSVLVRQLLEQDYKVRVIDNLMHGGEPLIELINHPNFEFFKGDVRNIEDLESAIAGMDKVVHLAAIVGDPACAVNPELTEKTNLEASINFYNLCEKNKIKQFVFASTCSNYGKMADSDDYVNENSLLNPVSLYAQTKVEVEKFLLSQDKSNFCKPTCLRFSTVYGLSPRPRFDLTVNEFTKELGLKRKLVIFGEQFWRPYCHVIDLARSVVLVLQSDADKVGFDVFGVGSTEENYQKKMIVEEIQKLLPDAEIEYVKKDEDPRDYRVNFDKIKETLGFQITRTVPEGIKNILFSVENSFYKDPDSRQYKNVD